jgi:hypothetical protein
MRLVSRDGRIGVEGIIEETGKGAGAHEVGGGGDAAGMLHRAPEA